MTTPEYERDHDMELSFYSEDMEEEEEFFQTIANPLKKNIDLDVFMASSAHAKPWINTTSENLSKVWKIDLKTARNTLNVTLQHCGRTKNMIYHETVVPTTRCCGIRD